jgi:hypothetical protein
MEGPEKGIRASARADGGGQFLSKSLRSLRSLESARTGTPALIEALPPTPQPPGPPLLHRGRRPAGPRRVGAVPPGGRRGRPLEGELEGCHQPAARGAASSSILLTCLHSSKGGARFRHEGEVCGTAPLQRGRGYRGLPFPNPMRFGGVAQRDPAHWGGLRQLRTVAGGVPGPAGATTSTSPPQWAGLSGKR